MTPSGPRWQTSFLHVYPDARLDLHGMRVEQAERATEAFIETEAQRGKRRVVHVVTGKGTGALLEAIGDVLGSHRLVAEHALDPQRAGYRARLR